MTGLTFERRRDILDRLSAEDTADHERRDLLARYADGLPRPEVSRCPFTQAVVTRAIDTFGIDGPWWDVDAVLRQREPEPPTLWAFSGAMRLAAEIEHTDFLVKPGPGVPFVVEHLIRHPAVRAVVSTLAVGRHTGYVVCYFADGGPEHFARVNEWGAPNYWYQDDEGWWADTVTEGDQEVAFDLAPWIADGKLSWIAPGDLTLRLRSDVTTCPYLDLDGTHEFQRVQSGRAWVPSELVDAAAPARRPRRRSRRGVDEDEPT